MQKELNSAFIDLQHDDNNYQICEACGNRMEERGCKLKCARCGYFRSCSDLF
ncbi:MAG TPA: hypothetical protein VJK03_02100 [Candidatus Nanoarchaeia archaeon]|nr:hypothetical protein [Candidatus Nanoarchaeia archaeon]